MNHSTPTLIYLMGAGSCGSTILAMTLGNHSHMMSIGELAKLDEYLTYDLPCSCGERLKKCPFWSRLKAIQNRDEEPSLLPIYPLNTIGRILRKGVVALLEDPHFEKTVERNLRLYDEIARCSDQNIIIDSGKDLPRLYYLVMSNRIPIVCVYLVRDGRAFIRSMKKRKRMGSLRATLRWVRLNLLYMWMWRWRIRGRRRGIRLSYRELVSDTENVLRNICRQVGVSYEPKMLEASEREHHHIAGAPQRFSPTKIEAQFGRGNRLPFKDVVVFFLCGGFFWNWFFGANRAPEQNSNAR